MTAVGRLARGEREATVAFIVHLAEFDARRLYAAAGFSSTFRYCLEALHLSEDAAFNRIEAARAARAYPAVLDMLVAGTLSPTTARMLRRHLTPENHRELLEASSGKSKQQVEKILAVFFPEPDVPTSVRKLPSPPLVPLAAGEGVPGPPADGTMGSPAQPAPFMPPAAPRPLVRPLAAERYEIRFTASAATCEVLREVQGLLGHAIPSGDVAQIFERALSLLAADLRKKKFGSSEHPRTRRRQAEDSRNVPAHVRRTVWKRDEGRCAFVAADGRRCGERRRLEFHHDLVPYAVGGKPTVENIWLRCPAHNRYDAEQFYGPPREYGGIDHHPSRDG
jgi:hypothetical protein